MEDRIKLAIGRAVAGGSTGTAALEGYAAAIEVLEFCALFAYTYSVPQYR